MSPTELLRRATPSVVALCLAGSVALAQDGQRLAIDIAGTPFDATASTAPAFDPKGGRMRVFTDPVADRA